MFLLWLLGSLFLIKIYNRLSAGRCYTDSVMTGKVAVVTGASRGIGFETALELARRGAKVILACRNDKRGRKATEAIKKITKNQSVRYMHLDLSSLASVRKFVDEFKAAESKLDVLVNNAGSSGVGSKKTEDGIILDMQINHFAPFLLTVLLVPMLKKSAPSRIVVVSSAFHRLGTINGINDEGRYNYLQVYSNSKLCNLLFSNELARRLEGTDVAVNSVNPGQVNTTLFRSTILEKIRCLVLYTFFKSPKEGAQTSIYLAVSDSCDQETGKYYVDCEQSSMSRKAEDPNMAAKLWEISEGLVKLRPEERISY